MTRKIKRLLQISFFAITGSLFLINCEADADNLGSQFFQNDAAQDSVAVESLIAYNVNNNDSIRTDALKLDLANLGAFVRPNFGLQKAAYFTQLRPSTFDPDFGTNAIADSAVLIIKPNFAADSITTTTNTSFNYPDGNILSTKIVNTYPVTKYGKAKIGGETKLTIRVNEVTDFLGSPADKLFSNQNFAEGALLGSKVFNGKITSVNIKKNSDNSEIINRDPSIRINLDAAFFQSKIIAKKGMAELLDAATFIRYFKGLKISVAENDGYLFKFNPDQIELVMYYKSDVVANGTTTRPQATFAFNLSGNNVNYQKIEYDRAGTNVQAALASSVPEIGDPKIYVQGMGGPGVGLKIPGSTLVKLRNLFNEQKAGILSARIRLYTDTSLAGNFAKPDFFTIQQKGLSTFLTEFTTYGQNISYNYFTVRRPSINGEPIYYEFDVTKTVKNIIETGAQNLDFSLNVGQYLSTPTSGFIGSALENRSFAQNFNNRSFTPNATVLVGTDAANPNRAQLRIVYAKK